MYERKYEGGGANGVEETRKGGRERKRGGERERRGGPWYVCTWTAIVLHCGGIDSAGGGTPPPPFTSPNIHPRSSPSISFAPSRNIHRYVHLSASTIRPLFFHPCPLASSWSCCFLSDFFLPLFASLSSPSSFSFLSNETGIYFWTVEGYALVVAGVPRDVMIIRDISLIIRNE